MNSRVAVIESRVLRLEDEMKGIPALSGQLIGLQTSMGNIIKELGKQEQKLEATLEKQEERFTETLEKQEEKLNILNNLASSGRGALWMFMALGGSIIALVAWGASFWRGAQ